MKFSASAALAACLALGAAPGIAWADFTVTFKNALTEDVKIVPQDHHCIHHPNNFETVLPAGKTTSIQAEWSDLCSQGDPQAFIEVCVDHLGAVAGCVSIEYREESKYVEVKQKDVGWPFLSFP